MKLYIGLALVLAAGLVGSIVMGLLDLFAKFASLLRGVA